LISFDEGGKPGDEAYLHRVEKQKEQFLYIR